jgi:hypothetical protein
VRGARRALKTIDNRFRVDSLLSGFVLLHPPALLH